MARCRSKGASSGGSRLATSVAVAAVLLAASCGATDPSNDGAALDATSATVAVATPPVAEVGNVADAVEVAAGAPGKAIDAACTADRQTLQTASELYEALNGALPSSQSALVDAQLLRELSPRYEITSDGVIVPAPGSTCS